MSEFNLYLLILCVLVGLFCALGVWQLFARRNMRKGENKFINGVLTEAAKQNSVVDLKLLGEGVRPGLTAVFVGRGRIGLILQTNTIVANEWKLKPVEAYFRVQNEEGPVFYVFESSVLDLRSKMDKTQLELAIPRHLRVEQKRHFIRVQPDQADILMIGVWPAPPGKRLPRANSDLGKPVISYKAGQDTPQVMVENISGSGLALRFSAQVSGEMPLDCAKGRQLICLLAFKPDPTATKPTIFWCTAEVMNSRRSGYATALGLEFTNWAIQEQGETEIHWMHNSPWRGVRPILQWVQRLDRAQHAKGG